MQGLILRLLFTGKFRTHNPVYLFVMLIIGIFVSLPLFASLLGLWQSQWDFLLSSMLYTPFSVIGIAFLVNVVASLTAKKPQTAENNGNAFF
ncbi:MAG: hypothetical protein CVU39_23140 [Chloroflexi bacterium HGW-Chloroflexi-10]|nr:MAG: hypothetical protein CVU39_23140 [Chloroflexi bacterium HGW-Chloroflexi-10]